ncbi:hypothetical protein [Sphingomonas turrisvirgatae]|uniref:hypothetical protein n=1 Tax=Sphingomonas turrisvirgatae TaxID=1888892 RepID=UPI0013010610|nr:hypothetical protein [Sphingomonas turrisvirgatae]
MRPLLLTPLLLIAACNSTDDSTGVSQEEAARLNAAAETLDLNAAEPDAPAKE